MEQREKRKYTFRALSDNSLNALAMSNNARLEEVKEKWQQIKLDNKMNCKICNTEKSLDNYNRININRNLSYLSWSTECKICELLRKKNDRNKRAETKGLEYNISVIMKEVKRRANKYKREYDLDLQFLVELYNSQEGICPYSGCKMSFDLHSYERLSLDRKDSNKGYTKDNVIWCCWIANNMKQDMTIEKMKDWISDIQKIINK